MRTGEKRQFTCKNCAKNWVDYVCNDRNKQFCSIACKSRFSRVDRVCKQCGECFTICKTLIEQSNATGNYCSRPCYIAKMTTGLTRNKNGFRTISERMRKAKPRCGACGTLNRIHIHHIAPYRYSKDNEAKNLIPLCISHHKVVEIITEKLVEIDEPQRVFDMMKIMLRNRQELMMVLAR